MFLLHKHLGLCVIIFALDSESYSVASGKRGGEAGALDSGWGPVDDAVPLLAPVRLTRHVTFSGRSDMENGPAGDALAPPSNTETVRYKLHGPPQEYFSERRNRRSTKTEAQCQEYLRTAKVSYSGASSGAGNVDNGQSNVVNGDFNVVNGDHQIVDGTSNVVSGSDHRVHGNNNVVNGNSNVVIGNNLVVSGNNMVLIENWTAAFRLCGAGK